MGLSCNVTTTTCTACLIVVPGFDRYAFLCLKLRTTPITSPTNLRLIELVDRAPRRRRDMLWRYDAIDQLHERAGARGSTNTVLTG